MIRGFGSRFNCSVDHRRAYVVFFQINKKVMGMIEKAETEYKDLIHKKEVVEKDKKKIEDVIDELDQKKNQTLQVPYGIVCIHSPCCTRCFVVAIVGVYFVR